MSMTSQLLASFSLAIFGATVLAGQTDTRAAATVDVMVPTDVTVEWLNVLDDGQLVRIGTKTFSAIRTLVIPLDDARARIVRFSPPGASPVSVSATDLARRRWTLPDVRSGGELMMWLRSAKVLPTAYRISGPHQALLERQGTFASAYGLPPGDYQIEPEYEGGITGPKDTARVESERSTFIVRSPQEVGAVQVSANPAACAQALHLRLSAVHMSASRVVGRLGTLVPIVSRADCQWTVAGLAPGNYEADLLLPTGPGGSSPMFTIRWQEITKVTIPPPAVRVDGSISLNGRPLANARLDFLNNDLAAFGTDTTTDADGRYAVTLARSGKYQMLVRARSAASAQKNVELRAGPNTVDLAIAGPGSISVRVKGARPEFPVTVHIEPGRVTNDTELAPGGELSFTKEGLDFGTYHVSATEGADRGVRTSAIKLVTLDSKHPAAAVELEIVENRLSLVLRDQKGNPVPNATVRATTPDYLVGPGRYRLTETQPGMYSLDGLGPGMYVTIRADDFVPACRTVPLNESIFMTLESGRRIEVQFPPDLTPAAVAELASISGVPGSDCPVPLRYFSPQLMTRPADAQRRLFRIDHFPLSYRFDLLRRGSATRRILVPDNGPVLVEPN